MVPMVVELLVVRDCPNEAPAREALAASLAAAGLAGTSVDTVVVDDQARADELGFIGSPSFYVDGVDVLPVVGAVPAVACRVYRGASGALTGVPDRPVLVDALLRATGRG